MKLFKLDKSTISIFLKNKVNWVLSLTIIKHEIKNNIENVINNILIEKENISFEANDVT